MAPNVGKESQSVQAGDAAFEAVAVAASAGGLNALTQLLSALPERMQAVGADSFDASQARHAVYSAKDVEAVPPELLHKYFEQQGSRYTFRNDMRRSVIFGRNDLTQDAPISHLDLLVCRNTLMYLNAETQTRVLAHLHFALKDTGYLFLGRAEMLLTRTNLFQSSSMKHRVFKRVPRVAPRERVLPFAPPTDEHLTNRVSQQVRLREAAFEFGPLGAGPQRHPGHGQRGRPPPAGRRRHPAHGGGLDSAGPEKQGGAKPPTHHDAPGLVGRERPAAPGYI